jgi:hypothetical protein
MACFDEEPDAARTLLWHPESECLFVSTDPTQIAQCLGEGLCSDVTGEPDFEARYANQKHIK